MTARRRRQPAQRRPESTKVLKRWAIDLATTQQCALQDIVNRASPRALVELCAELLAGTFTMLPAVKNELSRRAAGHRPEPLPEPVGEAVRRWFRRHFARSR